MELSTLSKSIYRFGTSGSKSLPAIGFGTYKLTGSKGMVAIMKAIEVGYRLIDTAHLYDNEEIVGQAVKESIKKGFIKSRDEIFITTKLATVNHDPDRIEKIVKYQNDRLGLDYIDLFLIHAPWGHMISNEKELNNFGVKAMYENNLPVHNCFDHVKMWVELEKCVDLGLIRHIGLSNFDNDQVKYILDNCRIKPFNNQVEIHPWIDQSELVDFHFQNQISVTSFMSLGRANRSADHGGNLFENEKLAEIAEKYNISIAQLLLKYQLQRNICIIPKSQTPSRIIENGNLFNFKIEEKDIKIIKGMNRNERSCHFLDNKSNPGFPTSWPKQLPVNK